MTIMRTKTRGQEEGSSVRIPFHSGLAVRRLLTVSAVVDLDETGSILAIEMLNLRRRLGAKLASSMGSATPGRQLLRISYDADCNALAIILREGRSVVQPTATVKIALGPRNQVVWAETIVDEPARP